MSARGALLPPEVRQSLAAAREAYWETRAAYAALPESEQDGREYEYYEDGLLDCAHSFADAVAALLEPPQEETQRLCGCGARHDEHHDEPLADRVREASALWEEIDDAGGPDAGGEEVRALLARFEAVTTASQRAALDPETGRGMFTAHVAEDGETVSFRTPEGEELPFTVSAGWSSVTAALPVVMIDTSEELGADDPLLRVYVNDGAVFDGL
ncbi:hypothetical protein [Leifsonia shinshuensis]